MNRVAITGCGVVCALGHSLNELAAALSTGRSGVHLVSSGPCGPAVAAACPPTLAADDDVSMSERALFDPMTRYAMHAAQEALEQSGLLANAGPCRDTGVYLGSALGGISTTEAAYRDIWYHGAPPKPLTLLCAMSNAPAAHLSIRYGLKGPNITFAVACASSAIAIGEAFHAIRAGRIGRALAGGTEACVTEGVIRAWQASRVMALADRAVPSATCKPFSRNRTGLVLGEGAAIFVLEPLMSAIHRGAPVLCELLGFGTNADASHICIPAAEGQAATMLAALEDAGLDARDIDYINAHGTGTRIGDVTETRAIRQTFGDHANSLAVSSTKSVHGHLLGAAAALELAVCIIALRDGLLPATMHLTEPDADCDLYYVPNAPQLGARVRYAMSNSFAFGGSNGVLVTATWPR